MTVNATSVTFIGEGTAVAYAMQQSGNTLTLTPSAPLPPGRRYVVGGLIQASTWHPGNAAWSAAANVGTTRGSSAPALAIASSGDGVLAWSYFYFMFGVFDGIVASVYTKAAGFQPSVTLFSDDKGNGPPVVAADSSGRAVVAYTRFGGISANSLAFAAPGWDGCDTGCGQGATPLTTIDTATNPTLSITGDGRAFANFIGPSGHSDGTLRTVANHSDNTTAETYIDEDTQPHVWLRASTVQGPLTSGLASLAAPDIAIDVESDSPVVAGDAAGMAVVAWRQNTGNGFVVVTARYAISP